MPYSPPNKKLIIFLLFIMAGITQAGLVLYTPAFLQIGQSLHISPSLVKTTLTGYLLGFGISQLIYGPLSDRIGRKKSLLAGMIIFSMACLWSIFSISYESFLFSRIMQGIGVGACMTLSRSILRDCFDGKEYVQVASYLSAGFAIGLGLTPVIGGHLLNFFSWRSEFVFLFLCGVLLTLGFWLFLPETYTPPSSRTSLIEFTKNTLKVFFSTLKNVSFVSYLTGGVMAYGVVIAYTTMTPFLFQATLDYSSAFYGWLTLLVGVAYYAGASTNRILVPFYRTTTLMKLGLCLILLSGFSMLLFKLAFDLFNLYVILIPLMVATFGQAFIWSNCIAGALKDLSSIAGTAAAFFSCLQMLMSAFLSGLMAMVHEDTQIPLSLVITALGLMSWIIFQLSVFGKERASSNGI